MPQFPTISAASSSRKRDSAAAFDDTTAVKRVAGQTLKVKKQKKNEPWPEYFNNVAKLFPINQLKDPSHDDLQLFKVRLI